LDIQFRGLKISIPEKTHVPEVVDKQSALEKALTEDHKKLLQKGISLPNTQKVDVSVVDEWFEEME